MSNQHELAKKIADYLIEQGTENTSNGSWIVYFNEIEDEFGVYLDYFDDLVTQITDELNPEIVADVDSSNYCFDMVFYLDYCPNIETEVILEAMEQMLTSPEEGDK